MASKVVVNGIVDEALAALEEKLHIPLLENESAAAPASLEKPKKTPVQKCLRKTLKGTANLTNLLPTGTVLTFQILSPVVTQRGKCHSEANQYMTLGLVGICCIVSFLLCFTDSTKDERGKVRHGVATFRGLWVIDGEVKLLPEESAKYRLHVVDFVHAFTCFLVFGAVAMFDQGVVSCLYPAPSEEAQVLLSAMPVGVGALSSTLFVLFPTTRHGIGFPLSCN